MDVFCYTTHTHMRAHTHTRTHAHMHTYTHAHLDAHTHTYAHLAALLVQGGFRVISSLLRTWGMSRDIFAK